ncbi:hypothetical protein M404DRAFT_24187 [Pisolithus tinctorius Marx 270]|uniref:Uncharacterized protein n=1 Tax=Pisolithus tinctorius Marx 270 TaxID=870435 RepID=A0A0C3KBT6_PISTI|nr:hypothetical protein M404DRAFT_24187 [Pisolithus tinctorius Marx 270]
MEEMTGRWDEFVEVLANMYPGAGEREKRYVKADLVDLVRVQSRKIIATEEDLREYLWQYETIVGYLNRHYKLTQEDYNGYFWEGLDPELQKDMLENLKFRNGLHNLDDPWPMNKVLREIKELLRHGYHTTRSHAARRGVIQLSPGEEARRIARELVQRQPQVQAEAQAQRRAAPVLARNIVESRNNLCVVEDDRVKFNDSTHVPRMDEPMYQLIDEWMERDRRRREEQQVPIIWIEHEEDPPTNTNMFVAAHNAFQYIERARIEEYVSDREDTAEEVISETEYKA